jgi:hypothetical protein
MSANYNFLHDASFHGTLRCSADRAQKPYLDFIRRLPDSDPSPGSADAERFQEYDVCMHCHVRGRADGGNKTEAQLRRELMPDPANNPRHRGAVKICMTHRGAELLVGQHVGPFGPAPDGGAARWRREALQDLVRGTVRHYELRSRPAYDASVPVDENDILDVYVFVRQHVIDTMFSGWDMLWEVLFTDAPRYWTSFSIPEIVDQAMNSGLADDNIDVDARLKALYIGVRDHLKAVLVRQYIRTHRASLMDESPVET